MNRRTFIKQSAGIASMLALDQIPLTAASHQHTKTSTLSILHTNDVHSRLEAFPMDGSQWQGLGGIKNRYEMIRRIREEEEHVLLLDAGDIFQGTPYFNLYKGKPEMQAMSLMGYDAATIGNHDFDLGMDNLAAQMTYADFEFVNCNYDVSSTVLSYRVKPYTIVRKGPLKIGILGVGIELKGLIPDHLCMGVQYHDPIVCANEVAYHLKVKKKCDFVICLSHLGFSYTDAKVSDKILAKESEYIDGILGGHTHTLLEKPYMLKNRHNKDIFVNQVGWAGTHLGRINIFFNHKKHYDYVSNFTVLKVKETRV